MTAAEKLTAQVRAKALAEGRAEGQAAVLLKLLGLRFGPLSEQQQSMVQAATPEPLDRWAEKVLSAAKLEDVLES